MSVAVQYQAGESFLHRIDPRVKLAFLAIFTAVIFATNNLWSASTVLVTIFFIWVGAGLPLRVLYGYYRVMVGFLAFLLIVQAFLYPGVTAYFGPLIPRWVPLFGGLGILTREGILFGLLLATRLLAMVSLLPLVTLTTPIHSLVLGLVRLGLPYQLAYTITTALNLVPVLRDEARTIMDAQRLRALTVFEKGNMLQKILAYPPLVIPLVIGAMRRAQLMSVAMDARAFGAWRNRTYIQDIRMTTWDWIFLIMLIIYGLGILALNFAL
ncbi:MAG: energy-coupling factor transporter transmembrane protein EcfT [Chloroflexi bacterium]|nr:energy-coupling factor transporter transmembrane protein EcfT [Chloroflexota bacterium]